jgi:hypothetical protein
MTPQFLLHLPDGTQYGPIDRPTLEAWHLEGRLPGGTLVWPEGAPEWVTLEKALEATAAAAPAPAPATSAPAPAPAPAAAAKPAAAPKPVAAATPKPASAAAPKPTPRPAPSAAAAAPAPAKAATAAKAATPVTARPAVAPAPLLSDDPQTKPSMKMPAFEAKIPAAAAEGHGRRPAIPAADVRRLVLAGVGLVLVAALLGGVWALLRPFLAKRRAIAEVKRYSLAERRVEDPATGLVIELPTGWLALRNENPYVVRPGARLSLAQPAADVYGAVSVAVRPALMDDLDGYLAEVLQQRLPRQPSQREGERRDVQLGRGKGRLAATTWEDGSVPMQGATVAWADGFNLFALEAWAPAAAGDRFAKEVEALCRGTSTRGAVAERIDEAVERLAVEVPELSQDSLRLLVAERLSEGRGVEDVPSAALRAVSRGLDALAVSEANEMRAIYQQVWEPVPEAERVRLAGLLAEVKAGRPVPAADVQALRDAVRTGVHALPEEQRARLQELSGRAVRKSLLLR